MTSNEQKMMLAILGSDYGNEPTAETWLWDVTERFGESAGGIMASLVKKGWAETTGLIGCDPGGSTGIDEGTCQLTRDGVDALRATDEAVYLHTLKFGTSGWHYELGEFHDATK